MVMALALGGAGGWVFDALRVPLPWIIGSLAMTTAAALAGLPLQGPGRLRLAMVAVLGLMLGSAFTPETFERASRWFGSLVFLLVFVAAVSAAVAWGLRRGGFDPATAWFAAVPGGFSEMVMVGGSLGGDERAISLIHSLRIMLSVITIPVGLRLFGGYQPAGATAFGSLAGLGASDAAILAAAGLSGFLAARALRVPAAALIGPMAASAVAHLSGLTAARPPGELVALAQVVIGSSIGCRFAGVPVGRVASALVAGMATGGFVLVAALAAAIALSAATGLPFAAILLAFAPGGLAEMSLVSLAMGVDTAFVSTHHIVRIAFLVTVLPFAFRLFLRQREKAQRADATHQGFRRPPS